MEAAVDETSKGRLVLWRYLTNTNLCFYFHFCLHMALPIYSRLAEPGMGKTPQEAEVQ